MRNDLNAIQTVVTSWAGISVHAHRFGGVEFNLGGIEVGHLHLNGMVDIPFSRKIRNQLIAEGRAEPHHILSETGWITFYIRSEADVQHAIGLFKLSYLFYATRGRNRAALQGKINLAAELEALGLSEPLRALFESVTKTEPAKPT